MEEWAHVTDRLPVPTRTLPSSTFSSPFLFPSRPEPKPCEANALLDLVILPSPQKHHSSLGICCSLSPSLSPRSLVLGDLGFVILFPLFFAVAESSTLPLSLSCPRSIMADITAALDEEKPSPTQEDLQQATGNGAPDNRAPKRNRMSADDDDDDDDKPGRERRKIEIKFIQDKSRRHITFSKRKAGIMKKVRCLFFPFFFFFFARFFPSHPGLYPENYGLDRSLGFPTVWVDWNPSPYPPVWESLRSMRY